MAKDKHVIEALGKARVTIENGKITDVGEPEIKVCPIFQKVRGINELTPQAVKENIEFRIDTFGYCTKERELELEDQFVAVGLSEIISTNLANGCLDCLVGACDGIGTLLITEPEIVDGVGGRVSALVSTSPIPELMEKVGMKNVVNPDTAELDPVKGLKLAIEREYKNIAITLVPSPVIKEIRELDIPQDVNVYLFIAHTTGISMKDTEMIFKYSDVITACASKHIRDYAEEHECYYFGKVVPIVVASEMGRIFLDNRLKVVGKPLSTNVYPPEDVRYPEPLI